MSDTKPNLVSRAQGGDPIAVADLYNFHHQRIFRYVWSKVSNTQVAEDLTGEVFIRMVRRLPDYRSTGAPFRAWLYRIARNLVVDYYRKEGGFIPLTLDQAEEKPSEINPASVVETKLTIDRLQKALAGIDTTQAEVIRLRFLVGLPIRDVAEMLEKSEASVKAHQHRGLLALRRILSQEK